MNTQNQTLEGKIEETQSEVKELETKLQVRKEVLSALREVAPLPQAQKRAYRTRKNKSESRISHIKGILTEAKRPMHLNEIIKTLGLKPTNGVKASVAGSLNNYYKRHKVFDRVAPNTFATISS